MKSKPNTIEYFIIGLIVGLLIGLTISILINLNTTECEGTYYRYNDYEFCKTDTELHSYQQAQVPHWYLDSIIYER